MFPDNIIKAAAELEILGIIVFSGVLGYVLVTMGHLGKPLLDVFESLNEVSSISTNIMVDTKKILVGGFSGVLRG